MSENIKVVKVSKRLSVLCDLANRNITPSYVKLGNEKEEIDALIDCGYVFSVNGLLSVSVDGIECLSNLGLIKK